MSQGGDKRYLVLFIIYDISISRQYRGIQRRQYRDIKYRYRLYRNIGIGIGIVTSILIVYKIFIKANLKGTLRLI